MKTLLKYCWQTAEIAEKAQKTAETMKYRVLPVTISRVGGFPVCRQTAEIAKKAQKTAETMKYRVLCDCDNGLIRQKQKYCPF